MTCPVLEPGTSGLLRSIKRGALCFLYLSLSMISLSSILQFFTLFFFLFFPKYWSDNVRPVRAVATRLEPSVHCNFSVKINKKHFIEGEKGRILSSGCNRTFTTQQKAEWCRLHNIKVLINWLNKSTSVWCIDHHWLKVSYLWRTCSRQTQLVGREGAVRHLYRMWPVNPFSMGNRRCARQCCRLSLCRVKWNLPIIMTVLKCHRHRCLS